VNRTALCATIATVVVFVVAGCVGLKGQDASSSSSSSGAAPSSTSASSAEAIEPLPSAIWGDWHAEVGRLDGVTSVAQPIRASFSWEDGRSAWLQLDREGRQVFQSTPLAAPAGEIRLRAQDDGSPCATGDDGRYGWSRSSDGLFLTLELIEDACAARGAALARTWVHSLSAVNDGGVGVVPNGPWIEVTLPHQRFAMGSGGTGATDIKSFDDSMPFKALIAVKDPMGFRAPCEVDQQPFSLPPDIRAFDDYAGNLPGLELDGRKTAIDGLDARTFEVAVSATFPCTTGQPGIFRSSDPTETQATWGYGPGDAWFMASLVKNSSLYVFTWEGNGQTAADADAIFESIRFFDRLPTP
jgi:hypothetical protein